jgi:hypothetical protein
VLVAGNKRKCRNSKFQKKKYDIKIKVLKLFTMRREVGPGISYGAYCYIAGKLAIFVPVDNLNNFDSDNRTIKSDFTTLRSVNLFFMHTFNGKAVIRLCIKRYLVGCKTKGVSAP